MAEVNTDWDAAIAKTKNYLSQKFNAKVVKHFMNYVEEYDDLKDITVITDDLELEDEDSWQNSNIVDEIATNADLSDHKKQLLFHKLRVCFGLEEESIDITLLDELNFNVTKEEIAHARKYMLEMCPGMIGMEDQTLFRVIAVGIKNDNFPLLSLLNDLFQFWKLNTEESDKKVEHFSENEWVTKSKYLSSIKQKGVQQLIIGGIRSYARRVLPGPNRKHFTFIDDSLSEYINLILSASAMIKNVIDSAQNSNQTVFPMQFDVWIIPKNHNKTVMATAMVPDSDDDSDYDEGDDEKGGQIQNPYIDIGDIGTLLKKDRIKYAQTQIDIENEANCVRTMRGNMDTIIRGKQSIRTVMIVDKRGSVSEENKYDLYTYIPPKPFGDIRKDYCIEQLLNNTSKYLIAHPNDAGMAEDIDCIDIKSSNTPIGGGYTGSGREFCISFHVYSVDRISMYVWMHGFGVRFMPSYLLDVLPKYFKNNDLKENGIDQKYINDRFKLDCTDHLFNAWNKLINEK